MNNLLPNAPDQEKITLLAVSNEPEDPDTLAKILGDAKCKIRTARGCREALKALAEEWPSVIACDRELPDGTWRDLMSLLHAVKAAPPPLVVMSRHADERLWAEVLNLGGYDVIAKPFDTFEVSRVMNMAYRHGRPYQPA
jgi:DNA-binding NtrC family response regulator